MELLFADSGLVPSIATALSLPIVDWLGGPAAFGVVLVRRLSQKQEKVMDHIMESSRDFSQWFGDNLEGVEEIKLWNLFESRDRAFQDKLDGLLKRQKGALCWMPGTPSGSPCWSGASLSCFTWREASSSARAG